MIEKLKKILWKVDGMEFTDNPVGSKGAFQLKYGKQVIGILSYENNQWTFEYSDEFKKNQVINLIIDFPDPNKVYTNEQLWPFFASRIPSLNQSFQFKKIDKANIKQDDSVGLLRLFGNETINNPFRLFAL
ncbi:MAG: HipA N-terminal domain-containing protein [Lentimicrobiaceae bacterium]|jgi:HipA-like protein|nr:HipA N-terminal domain-containing protein [Lentimicrobiaceae bacterium]